ncbi:hypothetical protein BC628DRAFT_1327582 [Trametes gibbosa]|uniref:RING-type domain-containing protein n=1 Tax=Trametes gibbosa TaxID=160864 RepID=A0A6G6FSM5_9APHY|nr:hypothetical protein BC628DRAFT_1327582 [Trametes gibbosa]QIE48591.1 hypothetical protein [Trametes gibbosa]
MHIPPAVDDLRARPIEAPGLEETASEGASATATAAAPLKRSASEAFKDVPEGESSRKRLREDSGSTLGGDVADGGASADGAATLLADGLEEELQCGCCSAIVYRPVVVAPCQHFFCGSCVTLWIRNGGTSCPACRTVSTSVSFSRPLQTVVDTLLRHVPGKARPVSERMQADAIYQPGLHLRIPSPRQASPEPNVPAGNGAYVRPCPHCVPGNQWGWRCPQPIVDPDADPTHAWPMDDGNPPGHGVCGNCENVLALQAPTTTRCDFCQVSFCGISIPQRCIAAPLTIQQPHGFSDLSDVIQCGEIYDCFDGNTVEVDIMLDYLSAQGLSPRHIYREIVAHIQGQPRQFAPLIELDLFMDLHPVSGGIDPDPNAPRTRICRVCAAEVLMYGLRDWWIRERKKGFLEENVMARPDCPHGSQCARQKDHVHAKEFNHIIAPPDAVILAPPLAPAPAPLREPDVASVGDFPPLVPAPLERQFVLDPAPEPGPSVVQPADVPLPPVAFDIGIIPSLHTGDIASAPSSQDFRDEVDALL